MKTLNRSESYFRFLSSKHWPVYIDTFQITSSTCSENQIRLSNQVWKIHMLIIFKIKFIKDKRAKEVCLSACFSFHSWLKISLDYGMFTALAVDTRMGVLRQDVHKGYDIPSLPPPPPNQPLQGVTQSQSFTWSNGKTCVIKMANLTLLQTLSALHLLVLSRCVYNLDVLQGKVYQISLAGVMWFKLQHVEGTW